MANKLTKKQKDFCEEVAKDGNASRSAEQVYNTKNNATARAIGSENLTKSNIIDEIADIVDKQEGGTDQAITSRLIKRAKDKKNPAVATRNDEILLKVKGKFQEQKGMNMTDFLDKLKK